MERDFLSGTEATHSIIHSIREALDEFLKEEASPENIRHAVRERLSSYRDKIMLTAIGLESGWGGRDVTLKDPSIVTNLIKSRVEVEAAKWLQEASDDIVIHLNSKRNEIIKEVKKKYVQEIKEKLYQKLCLDADKAVNSLLSSIAEPKELKNMVNEFMLANPKIVKDLDKDFMEKPVLKEAVVRSMISIGSDGKANKTIDDPKASDVRFVVKLRNILNESVLYIATDGDKWQPYDINGAVIINDIPKPYAVFNLMGGRDKQLISEAIDKFLGGLK